MYEMYEKFNRILERFEQYYPDVREEVVDWWPSGRTYLTIKLEDGMLMEYDYNQNTIRRVRSRDTNVEVDDVKKEVGRNLQKLIASRGMSQASIAERTGMTPAMLSRYIHGTSLPGVDKLYSLASVLGCRPADILDDTCEDE